jgi:hypothetical protein
MKNDEYLFVYNEDDEIFHYKLLKDVINYYYNIDLNDNQLYQVKYKNNDRYDLSRENILMCC